MSQYFKSSDDVEFWALFFKDMLASSSWDEDTLNRVIEVTEMPFEDGLNFQERVGAWMLECFGAVIAADRMERNHRFTEEALELVQACGATAHECHQLVDYVFGRDVGEKRQEVGGVMVTLAALCSAQDLDMDKAGEREIARAWTVIDQIRAKQEAKPKFSPLPQAAVTCEHPIWEYLGGDHPREGGGTGQLHRCVDCLLEEQDVPEGSVMIGHAPGECDVCDRNARELPVADRRRWVELTEQRRF